MTKIIYPKTFNVIDKWVANNLLLGKVLPQHFVIVNGGTSILAILQPLPNNEVKCVSISEDNFGELNVRKVQTTKDGGKFIKNDNHMYYLVNSKKINVKPEVYTWANEQKVLIEQQEVSEYVEIGLGINAEFGDCAYLITSNNRFKVAKSTILNAELTFVRYGILDDGNWDILGKDNGRYRQLKITKVSVGENIPQLLDTPERLNRFLSNGKTLQNTSDVIIGYLHEDNQWDVIAYI